MSMNPFCRTTLLVLVTSIAAGCGAPASPDGGTAGGSTAGGSTAGGSTAGGSTAGGSTAGGSTAGGSTAGGGTAGGSTAGGGTAGGSTAGGSTAGGSTAGGSTAGGGTAGGGTAGGAVCTPTNGGVEICDGLDNDCDGAVDDAPTDLGPCDTQNCPGGAAANCIGQCAIGAFACADAGRVCVGSRAPSAELCDGTDNDCNGTIDDPFVKAGTGIGAVAPVYSVDPSHCGSCAVACSLANAANGCRETAPDSGLGECFVQTCNTGFEFPTRTTAGQCSAVSGALSPAVMTGSQNGVGGLGCYYACPARGRELCDGLDNDCDGCLDNSNVVGPLLDGAPNATTFCLQAGECGAQGGTGVTCGGRGTPSAAWRCDYAGQNAKTGVDLCLDATGAPTSSEVGCQGAPSSFCDTKDNNCNGRIDDGLGVYEECTPGSTRPGGTCAIGRWTCSGSGQSTCSSGFWCTGSFCVTACSAGLGVCRLTGPLSCGATPGAAPVCPVVANVGLATNEACDGLDNDCDGLTDERSNNLPSAPIKCGGGDCLGYRDPMVQVQPRGCACSGNTQCPTGHTCATSGTFTGRCVDGADSPQACTADAQCTGGGTNRCTNLGSAVYVYQYEASRPGATAGSAGVDDPDPAKRRACARPNTRPWAGLLHADAAAACALVSDSMGVAMRLCTQAEWQAACVGSTKVGDPQWSLRSNPTTFDNSATACNAENPTGAIRATAPTAANVCSASFGGTPPAGQIYDLTGNVLEWTSTAVISGPLTSYRLRGGAFDSPRNGAACEYSFNVGASDLVDARVGFRCCASSAP